MQDLIDYRAELRSEDVVKIGGLEIGILKLKGAMAIMEVMRLADEDELMVRRALLAAEKARLSVETSTEDNMTKTVVGDGMAEEVIEGAMDLIGNEEPLKEETEVLQTDNHAMNDAIVDAIIDAIVDIQHEEERAELLRLSSKLSFKRRTRGTWRPEAEARRDSCTRRRKRQLRRHQRRWRKLRLKEEASKENYARRERRQLLSPQRTTSKRVG